MKYATYRSHLLGEPFQQPLNHPRNFVCWSQIFRLGVKVGFEWSVGNLEDEKIVQLYGRVFFHKLMKGFTKGVFTTHVLPKIRVQHWANPKVYVFKSTCGKGWRCVNSFFFNRAYTQMIEVHPLFHYPELQLNCPHVHLLNIDEL